MWLESKSIHLWYEVHVQRLFLSATLFSRSNNNIFYLSLAFPTEKLAFDIILPLLITLYVLRFVIFHFSIIFSSSFMIYFQNTNSPYLSIPQSNTKQHNVLYKVPTSCRTTLITSCWQWEQVKHHFFIPPEQCSTLDIMLLCVPEMYFCVKTLILFSHTAI